MSTQESHRGRCWALSCFSATSMTSLTQLPRWSDCLLMTSCCTAPSDHKMTICRKTSNIQRARVMGLWGMKFNAKKCYIMSVKCKTQYFYQLNGTILVKFDSYYSISITSLVSEIWRVTERQTDSHHKLSSAISI